MESDHATQLAALKEASETELMKVQQENYQLTVVSCDYYFICVLMFAFT